MSILSRLFGLRPPRRPVRAPEDEKLTQRIKAAKRLNARVVSNFLELAAKQERDALSAQRKIQDVLRKH